MAHSALHMAAGLWLGTAAGLPAVAHRWRAGERLAAPVGRLLLLAYGIGALAVVPNVLRRLSAGPEIVGAWWMNVFVLHPTIERFASGGLLKGEVAIAAGFVFHYAVLAWAVRRAGQPRAPGGAKLAGCSSPGSSRR
jgi:hypothetical protein